MFKVQTGLFSQSVEWVSSFDLVQLAFQRGQAGVGPLFVLFFGAWIALLVMAFSHQRRWVFITGASITVFSILLDLFTSSGNPIGEDLALQAVFRYVPAGFLLAGFFAKPPDLE